MIIPEFGAGGPILIQFNSVNLTELGEGKQKIFPLRPSDVKSMIVTDGDQIHLWDEDEDWPAIVAALSQCAREGQFLFPGSGRYYTVHVSVLKQLLLWGSFAGYGAQPWAAGSGMVKDLCSEFTAHTIIPYMDREAFGPEEVQKFLPIVRGEGVFSDESTNTMYQLCQLLS